MPRSAGWTEFGYSALEYPSRHMASLATLIRYEILLFLGALALIVTYQLVTGRINMRRLLFAKGRAAMDPSTGQRTSLSTRQNTDGLSPSRIQLLVISIGVAIYLLAEIIRDPGQFPEIPTGLLLLMAGSETIYLARKANNLLLRRSIRRNSQK